MKNRASFKTIEAVREFARFATGLSLLVIDDLGVIHDVDDVGGIAATVPLGQPFNAWLASQPHFVVQFVDVADHTGQIVLIKVRDESASRSAILPPSGDLEDLENVEQFLEHAEQLSALGCFEWDIISDRVRWTDGLYRIYGLEPQEFEATLAAFIERVIPEDRAKVQATVQAALESGQRFTSVERIQRADGEIRNLESRGQVITDEGGRPLRLIGVCKDVTERVADRSMLLQQIDGLKLLAATAGEIMANRDCSRWRSVFRRLAQHLDCDGYASYKYNDGMLQLEIIEGYPEHMIDRMLTLEPGESMCSECAVNRELLYLPRDVLEAKEQNDLIHELGVRAYVCVPLVSDDRLLGAIAFSSWKRDAFAASEIDYLRTVGMLVAAAKSRDFYESELRERDHRLQAVADNTADMLLMLDLDGAILDVNRGACETLGYDREVLLRMQIDELDVGRGQATNQTGGTNRVIESCYRRKDGSKLAVEVRYQTIHYQGQEVVLALARDISERLRMAREKRRAEETSRMILNHARMVTWEASPLTLNFRFVDGPCLELLGFKKIEWMRPGFWKRQLHPNDLEAVTVGLQQETIGKQDFEFRMLHANGRDVWVTLIVEAIYDSTSGNVETLRGVLTDVTARKRLEDQLRYSQKMEAVGRLAGGVAHDFNNLLTVITTFAEILNLEADKESSIGEAAHAIQDAATRASDLTAQLLMFGRNAVRNVQVVDLNIILKNSRPLLERLVGDDVELHLELASELPGIKLDTSHLDQVIVNLTVNARDAMPAGGQLVFETSVVHVIDDDAFNVPSGEYVSLCVTDTGSGMTDDQRARAFEPFFTTKEIGQGTGLGLAVVYGVVKECAGAVCIESWPEKGTSIQILLPLTHQANTEPVTEHRREINGGEHVLLVEDDPSVRRAAAAALRRHGYIVSQATNGQEVLAMSHRELKEFDLLLTDIVMPNISGLELAKAVREICPQTRVLYMSGYSRDLMPDKGSSEEYIRKPFTLRDFVEKVRCVLDRPETRRP